MATNESVSLGVCRCCRETKRLRLSHIISKLAYRRMKRFPGQNRLIEDESEIVQDGPKRHLLCDDCEQMLGVSERLFNNRFLAPYYKAKRFRADYGDWLARFAAANVWRVLITSLEDGKIPDVVLMSASEAEATWRKFIRNDASECPQHDLHVVLIDNRPEWAAYAEGAIEFSIVANAAATEAYVVAKLPGLAIIGVLREPDDPSWIDTKIDPVGGRIDASVDCRWPDVIDRYFRRQIAIANRATKVDWS